MSESEDKSSDIDITNLFDNDRPELESYVSKIKSGKASQKHNGWTSSKETIIKGWIEENQIYAWLLEKEAILKFRYDALIMTPLIFLAGAKGIATLGTRTLDESTLQIFNLVGGIVDMIIASLALFKMWANYGKTAQLCQMISKRYNIMNNDFKIMLGENINERPNGTILIREKNKERNDLYENTPQISARTWNLFYKELAEGKILDIETSILMKQAIQKKYTTNSKSDIEMKYMNNQDVKINIDDDKTKLTRIDKDNTDNNKENKISGKDIDDTGHINDNTNDEVHKLNSLLNLPVNQRSQEIKRRIQNTLQMSMFKLNKI